MRGRSVSMETMSRGGAGLPTSLSGGGLAHISMEVRRRQSFLFFLFSVLIARDHYSDFDNCYHRVTKYIYLSTVLEYFHFLLLHTSTNLGGKYFTFALHLFDNISY